MATVHRALPSKVAEGQYSDMRSDSYGNLLGAPMYPAQQAADEGAYYMGVNAASGTAITASIATAYSATASAFIALRNTDTGSDTGSGKRIILDYIKLQTLVVPASASEWQAVCDVDNVLTRFTSGGTAITPANANMVSTSNSVALLNAGALTTVALSSAGRSLGQTKLRTLIPVIGDEYIFTFGRGQDGAAKVTSNSTVSQTTVHPFPPAIIGPGGVFCLSLFGAANASTAATYFVTCGWIER